MWDLSMSDCSILSIISKGYVIEFLEIPAIPLFVSILPSPILKDEIHTLLQNNAVKEVPSTEIHGGGFAPAIFLFQSGMADSAPFWTLEHYTSLWPTGNSEWLRCK